MSAHHTTKTCGFCQAQAHAAQQEAQSGDKQALQRRFEALLRQSRAAPEPAPQPRAQTVVVRGDNSAVVVETTYAPPAAPKGTP